MRVTEMCSATLRYLAGDLDRQANDAEQEAKARAGSLPARAFWDGIATRARTNARDYRRKALKAEKAQKKKETVDG